MLTQLVVTGADPGFQVRGGGGLKKIAPSGGRRENFGVFRVKNHDFTPKKSYFFQFYPPPWIRPRVIHSCAICMNYLVNRLQDISMSV